MCMKGSKNTLADALIKLLKQLGDIDVILPFVHIDKNIFPNIEKNKLHEQRMWSLHDRIETSRVNFKRKL